jgi:hypothetical protein
VKETGDQRRKRTDKFPKVVHELREAGSVGIDRQRVMDLSQKYR